VQIKGGNTLNELTIVEYQNKRVLTTQQLADVYETDQKNVQANFANNKDRFTECRDFYLLQGDDLKQFKLSLPNDVSDPLKFVSILYLWTERGANRHCKILGTDKAWDQFDVLEENYFKTRNRNPLSELEILVQSAQALLEHDKAIKQLASTQNQQGEQLAKLIDIQSRKAEVIKELPPVNPMALRLQLNQIIRGYADRNNIPYGHIWSKLYDDFLHRYSINLKVRAKNKKQSVIDYAEHHGYLPDMLALAVNMFC
jgi:hypothetical protein